MKHFAGKRRRNRRHNIGIFNAFPEHIDVWRPTVFENMKLSGIEKNLFGEFGLDDAVIDRIMDRQDGMNLAGLQCFQARNIAVGPEKNFW